MARALEIAQLLERDRMAQVQVGRRRIHPELDSQRPAVGELRRQLGMGDYFDGVAAELVGLLSGVILVNRQSGYSLAQALAGG